MLKKMVIIFADNISKYNFTKEKEFISLDIKYVS